MNTLSIAPGQIPSSSQLYRRAAAIQPGGSPLLESATCAMCGAHLQAGELADPIGKDTFGESFNNKLDMHHDGTVLCGDCIALWCKDFLQSYSKSYACEDGVYKLASNEDVQAFMLRPPKTPFVAIFNSRQQQHMIWRTPLSLSQDVMTVRVDDDLIRIDRQLALDGARAWRTVEACMKTIGMKGLPVRLERTLSDQDTGVIRSDVIKAVSAHSTEGAQAIGVLHRLRMGEWWALCALRYIDQDAPQTWPHPVKLKIGEPLEQDQ